MATDRAIVALRFETGEVFSAWESFSLRESFTDPLGEMSFTARPPRPLLDHYNEHLVKGRLVGVTVNNVPTASCLITTVDTEIGRDGISFKVECKTPLVTLYEASADPEYNFAADSDATISTVLLDLLRPYGFEEVFVDAARDVNAKTGKPIGQSGVRPDLKALKHSECLVNDGETVFGVATRVVTRLGLCIRCDADGHVLLGFPRYDQQDAYTVVQDFDRRTPGDRWLDGLRVHDTNDGQYSECVVRGKPVDKKGTTRVPRLAARVGVAALAEPGSAARPPKAPFAAVPFSSVQDGPHNYSSPIAAPYKPKHITDQYARDEKLSRNAARLFMAKQAKDAFTVEGEVGGLFSQTGRVWSVDTMARVVVRARGIDQSMYLLERTLIQSRDGGQRTRLKFVPKGSVVLGEVPS